MVWNKESNINNIHFETYTESYVSRSKHIWSVLKIFHTRMCLCCVSIMKLDITKTVCVHSVELFSIYNLHTYITSCCYCNPFKMSIK